jgi:signal transduction histidine kinase
MTFNHQAKSRLSTFIRGHTEAILIEWEAFARSLPMGDTMDVDALRDHAKQMLAVIATDLDTAQTAPEQHAKSRGRSDAHERQGATAAQEHGAGRAEQGFSVDQMVAEFRALRSSVIRLWTKNMREADLADLDDITRFNEAIDQAIAESITRFTKDVGESKERFLAILGHDLRTPLGAIITSTQFMLDDGELHEPNLTLVTRVSTSARRMNQMVLDLLDFTRTRFGDTIPVIPTDMDARKMVHDVVAEIATMYPSSTVHVETSGDLRGRWDQDRLAQALSNLIANAVQHGSERSTINVAAHGFPTEVTISVTNHGPVIPESEVPEIFQAMKQSRSHGARDRRHLGLGLYIVDKIVRAHLGSVAVQSSREHGTTFTMHLPRS